ncbi:MAG: hypothetical protein JJ892_10555 [Balneola sp.]|nr:hypothetical protein [Balneola sp.]MBO6651014.1 hypothetical protein [Balneola sp.]MBO6711175.1 hypothetical protein [Balneola sp.]MBO6800710.1 hypothetical protein [Balneola sp.]MBO6869111.1 hypothetical protein [Balneola sp.]
MKSTLIIFASFIFLLIATAVVHAQPGLPSNPAQAPIDGGLGILAAAGGAYAYKKLRGNRGEKEGSV